MKYHRVRISFLAIFAVLILTFPVVAQKSSEWVVDKFRHAERVDLHGFIGERLDLSYENRVLSQDVNHLIEPFRKRTETRLWQSEFWGKWFTSAVLAYKYNPDPRLKQVLQESVESLIKTQTPDGYIGNYTQESHLAQWDIWGRKYTMLGLLDYHELTKDQGSLGAARKVADHLIMEIAESGGNIVTKGNYRGMAASSVLEPMLQLYRITKDKKYLDFSEQIVRDWETPQGPRLISKSGVDVSKRFPKPKSWYSPEQGQKAYEMMSCYEGLLELYRITGEPGYKEAVEKTWKNIKDTEINIAGSGASEEMWFGGHELQTTPVAHYQETCVTVTWIKLNQQLLRLTGEGRYADEIERSYYNALLASLNYDASDWAKYTPLNGQRLPGSGQCGMNLNCCNASGPRGQFTLPLTAVMSTADGLAVNFYLAGDYNLKTPKGKAVALKQETDYPVSGNVRVSLDLARDEEMTLQFRIPAWSIQHKLVVNGETVSDVKPGQFVKVNRKWSSKDIIDLELDMRGKVTIQGDSERKFASITRGPVVLAMDSRFPGPPLGTVNQPLADGNGYIELQPVATPAGDNIWMQYKARFRPESYMERAADPVDIMLCDYASAGNGKEQSAFQVWWAQLYSGRGH
jgi:uncharacterized protein